MAGDWIKMRDNLWDDPRVSKIVDMTESSEGSVIGALYWLWATADQHTEDGILPGLTLRAIDRKTGVPGFSEALCVIGWLADHPEGVRIIDFKKHNGSSAKKRCQTAKRVANSRNGNADVTLQALQGDDISVSGALAREREEKEKRREEDSSDLLTQSEQALTNFSIPLVDSTEYRVPVKDFETWTQAYPAVDVGQELLQMAAWVSANPTKRKTRRGVASFAVRWLSKAQDFPHRNTNFAASVSGQSSALAGGF